ncbi:MAG: ribonuclease HII [Rickettsiales bacterium]
MPNLALERNHTGIVCGIDEAGRGPLAGPVVAAAIILPAKAIPRGINDSKKLTSEKRAELFDKLRERATIGIGIASVEEIDQINILRASLLAMQRAYDAMETAATLALIDGNFPPVLGCQTQCVIKGDSISLSIAAASIVAKVTRDRIMHELAEAHPEYGFERHAGYATATHLAAIEKHGPCLHHRKSFSPIKERYEAA